MERVGVLYSEQREGRESSVIELYAWISNALTRFLRPTLGFHVVSTPAHVLPFIFPMYL